MLKKISAIFVSIVFLIPLCACYDYTEIASMSFVAGMAIDKEEGEYLVTAELLNMTGGEGDYKPVTVEAKGDTVIDAMLNMIATTAGKLDFKHCQILILGEELARVGIKNTVNMMYKNIDFPTTMFVLAAHGEKGKDIINSKGKTMEVTSFEIEQAIKYEMEKLAKSLKIKLHTLYSGINTKDYCTVLPSVHLIKTDGEEISRIDGLGIFKEDKLVGYLDGQETKAYLFLTDNIKGGIITIEQKKDGIGVRLQKNKTKIKPVFSHYKNTLEISTDTVISFTDLGSEIKNDYSDINKLTQKEIQEKLTKLIKKTQTEFELDIFNFWIGIKKLHPKEWKNIQNWQEEYCKIIPVVKSKTTISGTHISAK